MPGEPRTTAGRRLFSRLWAVHDYDGASLIIATVQHDLVAIEEEAAALDVDRLRKASEVVCGCYNLEGGFDTIHARHVAAEYARIPRLAALDSAVRDQVGTEEPGP